VQISLVSLTPARPVGKNCETVKKKVEDWYFRFANLSLLKESCNSELLLHPIHDISQSTHVCVAVYACHVPGNEFVFVLASFQAGVMSGGHGGGGVSQEVLLLR